MDLEAGAPDGAAPDAAPPQHAGAAMNPGAVNAQAAPAEASGSAVPAEMTGLLQQVVNLLTNQTTMSVNMNNMVTELALSLRPMPASGSAAAAAAAADPPVAPAGPPTSYRGAAVRPAARAPAQPAAASARQPAAHDDGEAGPSNAAAPMETDDGYQTVTHKVTSKLPTPPVFTGERDDKVARGKVWLSQVMQYCSLYNWTLSEHLRFFLGGKALEWLFAVERSCYAQHNRPASSMGAIDFHDHASNAYDQNQTQINK
jgi:hypothetical protein